MDQARPPATSVFEYLTHRNPRLKGSAPPSSQSRNEQWYTPVRVSKWKDFNFATTKQIFEGRLWAECRAPRSPSIVYPPALLPEERSLGNEEKVKRILNRWTIHVVNVALNLVRRSLNPVVWVPGDSKRYEVPQVIRSETDASDLEKPQPGRRRAISQHAAQRYEFRQSPQPTEKAQSNSMKRSRSPSAAARPATKKLRTLVPDGGGVSVRMLLQDRLPSDIKSSWVSREVTRKDGRYLDRKGFWKGGMSQEDQARPLRQIYTYCVVSNSRYGFIITCDEVFLVRISPLGEVRPEEAGSLSEDAIKELMIDHGRLEYKSIRWEMHRRSQQSLDDFQELTVNLSLWILFILAGNNWQIGWDYKPLAEECLARVRENSGDAGSNTDGEDNSNSESDPDQDNNSQRNSRESSSESTQKAATPPLDDHESPEEDDEINVNPMAMSFSENLGSALSAAVASKDTSDRRRTGERRSARSRPEPKRVVSSSVETLGV